MQWPGHCMGGGGMIRKSGYRFSEEIMLKQKAWWPKLMCSGLIHAWLP
jgi:hypothetical protein